MKHILLITVAFFFGLSSLADHEGKSREEITYEDIYPHITNDTENAFYLYMAEEKEFPYFMEILGFAYHNKDFELSGFPQDYHKAVYWKKRYLESGYCPSQAIYSLYEILRERDKTDRSDLGGRPEHIKVEEIAVLLHAIETVKLKGYLDRLPSLLLSTPRRELGNKAEWKYFRERRHERMVKLESAMTVEEIKEAYLEVERLENLLGDTLYDESKNPCKTTDDYYSREERNQDILEFLLEKGYIKVVE